MSHLLYLIGQSNTGKTTCLNNALPKPISDGKWPITHSIYPGGIQLGVIRDEFSGTDALGKHVQISVPGWLHRVYRPNMVVGEGMRFCTQKFMDGLLNHPRWEVTVLRVTCDEEILAERRLERTEKQLEWLKKHKKAAVHRDHEQTPEWIKSNKSSVDKLYAYLEAHEKAEVHTIDTTAGFWQLEQWLRERPEIIQMGYGTRTGYDPGTPGFRMWQEATMKGRELLKEKGATRWQWEPAMAYRFSDFATPTHQNGEIYIEFEHEESFWWIIGEPLVETDYAKAKRRRAEKLDAGKGERSELQDPSNPKCTGHSTGLHCACIDTQDDCCDCPYHINADGNLCNCEGGMVNCVVSEISPVEEPA